MCYIAYVFFGHAGRLECHRLGSKTQPTLTPAAQPNMVGSLSVQKLCSSCKNILSVDRDAIILLMGRVDQPKSPRAASS